MHTTVCICIVVSSHFSFTDHHDTSTAEHVLDHSCSTNRRSLGRPSNIHPLVRGTRMEVSFQHHSGSTCRYPSSPRQNCTCGAQRENSMALLPLLPHICSTLSPNYQMMQYLHTQTFR